MTLAAKKGISTESENKWRDQVTKYLLRLWLGRRADKMTTLFVDGRVVLVSRVNLEQWVRGSIDRPIEYGEVRPLARGPTNNRN